MNLLLDTHVFIWWASDPGKLSETALTACRDQSNTLLLSYVSIWEMQIKQQLGKLSTEIPLNQLLERQQQVNGLRLLPIQLEHIFNLNRLPSHHRDPFDRLLISQTLVENLTLVTADMKFRNYEVPLVW